MEKALQEYHVINLSNEETSITYTDKEMEVLSHLGSRLRNNNTLINRISLSIAMKNFCTGKSLFSSLGRTAKPPIPFACEVIGFIALMIGTASIAFTLMLSVFLALCLLVCIRVSNIRDIFDSNNSYIGELTSHWSNNADYYKNKHAGSNINRDGYSPDYHEMSRFLLDFVEGKPLESRGKTMHALYELCNDVNAVMQTEINQEKEERFNQLTPYLKMPDAETAQ